MTPADLIHIRTRYGKTQKEFSAMLCRSAHTYRTWEQGISPIPAYVELCLKGLDPPAPKPKEWTWGAASLTTMALDRAGTVPTIAEAMTKLQTTYPTRPYIIDQATNTVFVVV